MRFAAWIVALSAAAAASAGCGIEAVDYGQYNIGCRVVSDCPSGFACDGLVCTDTSNLGGAGGNGGSTSDGQPDDPDPGGGPGFDLGGLGDDGKFGGDCRTGDRCDEGLICHDDQCTLPQAGGA